jgi:Tetracyclin repressor-like, C-terminal domain
MRLYGYIATKDELLDLMVNALHAEIRPAGDGWREVLRSLPYLARAFATGRFPALAAVVRDGAHLDADQTFRIGLDFLLDGIEARISR